MKNECDSESESFQEHQYFNDPSLASTHYRCWCSAAVSASSSLILTSFCSEVSGNYYYYCVVDFFPFLFWEPIGQVFSTVVHAGAGSRWLSAGRDLRHKLQLFFFFLSQVGGDLAAANQHLCHAETKSAGSQQVKRESEVRVATFLRP